ncbi:FadR/GntR family transcriptional regulator [Sphingomonas caeni]|uniref:FadR/GntR family transcriptional regulator n=1 Tax=Sphingomonas caeni TaxID=2984949 RepID=UPI002232AAA5|nr:FadR/GntR family transcriptional regulator [Sphingomonas caeni]
MIALAASQRYRRGMQSPNTRLYEKVSAALASRIASGEFRIGDRLPSERELAQLHGVSRPTIREAIIALELDGLVDVRMGSGVYVIARHPKGGIAGVTDVGPFELLESRRAIEAETAALAALHITDEQLEELEVLLHEINAGIDFGVSEEADRKFHIAIAEYTGNSVLHGVVETLWESRDRSPQYNLLAQKAHEAGIGPDMDEHAEILAALRRRDPIGARNAMRTHLSRVIETLLEATEVHELEQIRERVDAQRKRFGRML